MGVLGRARVTLNDRFPHTTDQPGRCRAPSRPRYSPLWQEPRGALRAGPDPQAPLPSARGEGPWPPSIVRLLARLRHCLKNPPSAAASPRTRFGSAPPSAPGGRRSEYRISPFGSRGAVFCSGVRGGQPGRCEAAGGGSFPLPRSV